MRIKSKWYNKDRPKSVEENAGALAYITSRVAFNSVKEMFDKGFSFPDESARVHSIGEFAAFLIQVADRLVYHKMDEEERRKFITTLALRVADTMAENLTAALGEGEHRRTYIDTLNSRLEDYSECRFDEEAGEPGYQFRSYLGHKVAEAIGGEDSKWVVEHVAEIEAPEAVDNLKKGLSGLFAE